MDRKHLDNEDGVETMEWMAILVVACVLIGIVAQFGDKLWSIMNSIALFL